MPREDRDYRSSRDDDDRWRDSQSQFGGEGGRGDERSFRSRGRDDRDDDSDRDVLGRRRGGWFGDSERHAEVGRRSFEAHARAFGLPEDDRGGGRMRMSEDRSGYRMRGEEPERGYRMREDERSGYRMRGEEPERGYRMRGEEPERGYRMREDERGGYRMRGANERGGYGEDRPRGVGPSWYDEVERRRSQGWRGRDEDEGAGYRMRDDERGGGYRMRGEDERGGVRSRGGEDDERDRLGRRRGGWFGDPEGHAEVARRSFEAHARAFGLPEDGRGGERMRMSEDRGGYRSRRDEDDDRGYRSRSRAEDDDRGTMARGEEDEDRDRLGRRRGGWFGDSEGHAEAARRRWDRAEGRE